MIPKLIPLLMLLCAVAVAQGTEIHHHMTEDEIQAIFQVARHEVPDYEVVSFAHTLHKRSTDDEQIVRMRAFDRDIDLYLNPTEGLFVGKNTPVYTVVPRWAYPDNLKYTRINNAFREVGKAYQDILSNSAVIIQKLIDGSVNMVGRVLNDYVIKPLPRRLHSFLRFKRDINDTDYDDHFNHTHYHHIVFKRPDPTKDEVHKGIRLVERERAHRNDLATGRSKRSIPDVIFPESLIIMDYSLYKTQNKDLKMALIYLLSFWNAVDLRYRTMTEPRIRVNIAGFIIATEEGGTPYIENNKRGEVEVDADRALESMSKYFYREARFPFAKYDLALIMTHLDLCNMMGNQVCDTSTLGYAYEAGACNRSAIDRNTEAVGLVEDNGGFSAIIPATHEMGHLLGVPHDGVDISAACPAYEGYIMTAALAFGERNFLWSSCSVNAFQEFFNSPDATCLFNPPPRDTQLEKILPGTVQSLDAQCEKVYGTRACNYDATVCTRLECYVPGAAGNCRAVAAAAEGSYCGEGMHCISGHCLSVNETLIPEPAPPVRPTLAPRPNWPKFSPSGWKSPFLGNK